MADYILHCPECGAPEGEKHRSDCPSVFPSRVLPEFINIALPPEVQPYKEDIRRFVDAMIYKLGKNASKGRWQDMSIGDALGYLKAEVEELDEAAHRSSMTEMMLESADVANFALIISAIAIERGK